MRCPLGSGPWALACTAEQPVLFTATSLALVLRAFGTVPEAKLLSKHPPKWTSLADVAVGF